MQEHMSAAIVMDGNGAVMPLGGALSALVKSIPSEMELDEVISTHPDLLPEIMRRLPEARNQAEKRAKVVALWEWMGLYCPHVIPLFISGAGKNENAQCDGSENRDCLWFPLADRWVSEIAIEGEVFGNEKYPDDRAVNHQLMAQNSRLRWHSSGFLLQIEQFFKDWWTTSPAAPVIIFVPEVMGRNYQEVSEGFLRLSPDERAAALVRQRHPCFPNGRLFLGEASDELVAWRKAKIDLLELEREVKPMQACNNDRGRL
jgi:hypothetical protein